MAPARTGGTLPRKRRRSLTTPPVLGMLAMSAGDGRARSSQHAHTARVEDGSEGMRSLFIAWVVLGLGVGCATPRVPSQPLVSEEVERWQRRYQEERERTEVLAVRLARAESALEAAAQERAEAAQLTHLLEENLDRATAARHSLAEHNAQLVTRQRELTALQEELEDVWYQSALSRARRRSQPPPQPQEPEGSPSEGGSR